MSSPTKPRDRILDAADHLFYSRGIHAVGVDDVVAHARTAKTTLYAHFPSKDDLIASYLQRRSIQWREHLSAELTRRGGSPAEQIDAIFAMLALGCAVPGFRGCPFINAAAEYPDPAHPARVVADAHRAWVLALLTELAEDAGVSAPEALAGHLNLLYDAAMVGAQFEPGGPAPARAREAAQTLVSVAPRPQPRQSGVPYASGS